jgi:alkylhydroperoxidase/carboxymuconolactone decarboxylase family protein YurZ
MSQAPTPPETYQEFIRLYPQIGRAWEALAEAGRQGPLDGRTARLVKLAVALGAMREGAVHANVRKALAQGITRQEVEQVVALAAGTLGLPSAVAVYSWVRDTLADDGRPT